MSQRGWKFCEMLMNDFAQIFFHLLPPLLKDGHIDFIFIKHITWTSEIINWFHSLHFIQIYPNQMNFHLFKEILKV